MNEPQQAWVWVDVCLPRLKGQPCMALGYLSAFGVGAQTTNTSHRDFRPVVVHLDENQWEDARRHLEVGNNDYWVHYIPVGRILSEHPNCREVFREAVDEEVIR